MAESGGTVSRVFDLNEFRSAVERREMGEAMRHDWRPALEAMDPTQPDAAVLLECCARLLDRDPSHLTQIVDRLLLFDREARKMIRAADAARLDMVEAISRLHQERFLEAVDLFGLVARNADRMNDMELSAISRYYLARAYTRCGRYEEALSLAREAKALFPPNFRPVLLISMVEAWILFSRGDLKEALQALGSAAKQLLGAGDYIEDCNILSFYGRIARQKGDFDDAIRHFRRVIVTFEERGNLKNRYIARTYGHMAFAKLQKAWSLENQGVRARGRRSLIEQARFLRGDAARDLNIARKIFESITEGTDPNRLSQRRGLVTVHNYLGWLFLDQEEWANARKQVRKASRIADPETDRVVLAHSLITECMIENRDPLGDPHKALKSVQNAMRCAEATDRRRLKARAHIWLGMTLLKPPFSNLPEARKHYNEVIEVFLTGDDRDYLRVDFEEFEAEIKGAQSNEVSVAQVSLGEVFTSGLESTLREVEEKIVVRAYQVAGGSVMKTAKTLHTTRNRVRRVLKRGKKGLIYVE